MEAYIHGPTNCRLCFNNLEETLVLGDWRLKNNPGYYGSADPEILVLGFSKGANQNKVMESGDFDKVAFAKSRDRLGIILQTLKVMPPDRDIDALITARESTFGFASLVRCSFCKMKADRCKTSGDLIPAAFSNSVTLDIIRRCANTFLGKLPNRTRLVILLGTSDIYVAKTMDLFSMLYTDLTPINTCAFRTGNTVWVYATHPSPGNGHFNSWVYADGNNSSGKKRILALQALD